MEQNIQFPSQQYCLSRCRATLWSMVEHSAWLDRYPDGESQHCVPLQCAQKVCIHGLIQYKWPEHWLAFIKRLVFQLGRTVYSCQWLSRKPFIQWYFWWHSYIPPENVDFDVLHVVLLTFWINFNMRYCVSGGHLEFSHLGSFPKFSLWRFFLAYSVLHLHNYFSDTACPANSPLLGPICMASLYCRTATREWRHPVAQPAESEHRCANPTQNKQIINIHTLASFIGWPNRLKNAKILRNNLISPPMLTRNSVMIIRALLRHI